VSSIGNALANFRTGLVPWRTAILATYYGLDLACQPFSRRGFLDRVSANGFLRARFYARESVSETHQHFVLQASSIPNYELSAMTARRITTSWFRVPSPFMSVLKTDLQTGFIDPLERAVLDTGVEVERNARVVRLVVGDGRIAALELADGRRVTLAEDDRAVLALPMEVARSLLSEEMLLEERSLDAESGATRLGRLFELETAPRAALHVILKRKLTNLPKEHVVLFGSEAQLSFIDVSQWWPGFDDVTVLSASPERFLRLDHDRQVETRPIKGTRPRGLVPMHDAALGRALAESEKDRAENLMIVDLLSNDLSRVCRPGTVRVPELFALEQHPTVHHLVSTVVGELEPAADAVDLARAAFPGGSITGAPKVRAMEIIAELEPTRRGVYCGSIGYISATGAMDTSIVIRTFVAAGGGLYFQAGGGIVADSDPELEYRETLDKAQGLIETLKGAVSIP
jgi:hypothetical protein